MQILNEVSVSSAGEQGDFESYNPSISADGQFVVFGSFASTLVAGDTESQPDIFIRDRSTGVTERENVSSAGVAGNFESSDTSISADGRYAVFSSFSDNLVADDINGSWDIFVRDRDNRVTERISVSSTGEPGNDHSRFASISADGQFVAFESIANNLVTGDDNNQTDIFVHDRDSGVTERISVSSTGDSGNDRSRHPSISADGQFVAFESIASNLVVGDTNNQSDIFIHDRVTGVTERISVSSINLLQGNAKSTNPSISVDGQYVAFRSSASNLVTGDTNQVSDIFVHDRDTDVTERVSMSSGNLQQGNADSFSPSISADGRFVAFVSVANNLLASGDTNGAWDVFIRDRDARVTERVSESSTGVQGNSISFSPSISADGGYVAFTSSSNNLVVGDSNSQPDVFVTENPLIAGQFSVELLINNAVRDPFVKRADLLVGTNLRLDVRVTNNTPNRLYNVKVFSECNFYVLKPGESKTGCTRFQPVEINGRFLDRTVTAKISGSSKVLSVTANAHYFGHSNTLGELSVTHRINNINADTQSQAPTLSSGQAEILYKVENTGKIELYKVKTYHDPVSPVNTGWAKQCSFGRLEPGQVRYCKRKIIVTEPGLNHAMGRVQALNGNLSHTAVINAANPTYFIVP